MGYPTRLLGTDEEIHFTLRPHWKALILPIFVLIVAIAAAGFLATLLPDGDAKGWLALVIAGVWLIIVARWVLWPIAVWYFTTYVITNKRLIIRTGVLSRSGHDVPHNRINDVAFSHTFWERLLGCGTLVVESAGERGQLTLHDIPRVEEVQRDLYELVNYGRSDAARMDQPDYEERPPAERGDGT
ncbi:MAG TPA: PH domain-containing protein [Actinomycetes bacterium]|nr:PH domain-containing protein [Actinomycetes bacterium]